MRGPAGIVFDRATNMHYVADSIAKRILQATLDGTWTVIAGNGTSGYRDGPDESAEFQQPFGIAIDETATSPVIYVSDCRNDALRRTVDSFG